MHWENENGGIPFTLSIEPQNSMKNKIHKLLMFLKRFSRGRIDYCTSRWTNFTWHHKKVIFRISKRMGRLFIVF